MVAQRKEFTSSADHAGDMASKVLWFGKQLGESVIGSEAYRQLTDSQLYSQIILEAAASGKMKLEDGRLPTLYNISPRGSFSFLRELGFIKENRGYLTIIVPRGGLTEVSRPSREFVHIDKPFVAHLHQLSSTEDGLFNALSITYDPSLV